MVSVFLDRCFEDFCQTARIVPRGTATDMKRTVCEEFFCVTLSYKYIFISSTDIFVAVFFFFFFDSLNGSEIRNYPRTSERPIRDHIPH